MIKIVKQSLLCILCIAVLFAFAPMMTGVSDVAMAKSKAKNKVKYNLVKTVTFYDYNAGSKKWIKTRTLSYTYNKKGEISKVKLNNYNTNYMKDRYTDTIKCTHKYSKGKKTTTNFGAKYPREQWNKEYTYSKSGKIKKYNYTYKMTDWQNQLKVENDLRKFTYDKKGGIKTCTGFGTTGDEERSTFNNKYKSTMKGGKYKKIALTSTSTYGNVHKGTYNFNTKGYLKSSKGYISKSFKYTANKKKLITTINESRKYSGYSQKSKHKIKIAYNNKKTTEKRYRNMINQLVCGGDLPAGNPKAAQLADNLSLDWVGEYESDGLHHIVYLFPW